LETYVTVGRLSVAPELHRFVEEEAIPGSGVSGTAFWAGLESAVVDLAPRQRDLLARRGELQHAIDDYHRQAPGPVTDLAAYEAFLREIGYLVDAPEPFTVSTARVDTEISNQAGAQLVVPILNARFATNAANARWGSLYDALYGTDVIDTAGALAPGSTYNPIRGEAVIARGRAFFDEAVPLKGASHLEVTHYALDGDGLVAHVDEACLRLVEPAQLVGYRGSPAAPKAVLLVHHDLHVEIQVDRDHPVGATDPAGVCDIVLEAAVSTIMDLEDSVAAVDAADKVVGYRNWLLLMQGRLTEEVVKGGRSFTRTMHNDRVYNTVTGEPVTLPGRALLFVRQTGHLMTTDAVLDPVGEPVSEGLLDAFMTGLGSCHDLRGPGPLHNSRTGSMYAVKPKMHGPDEVALTVDLFSRVERTLGLPANTIKVGIMDEERRTSLNLAACIHAARDRVAFINTGFLDRSTFSPTRQRSPRPAGGC